MTDVAHTRSYPDTTSALAMIDRLIGRADAHDKMCFGSAMGLGYFSGNDARLLRDAAELLRGVAQAGKVPAGMECCGKPSHVGDPTDGYTIECCERFISAKTSTGSWPALSWWEAASVNAEFVASLGEWRVTFRTPRGMDWRNIGIALREGQTASTVPSTHCGSGK